MFVCFGLYFRLFRRLVFIVGRLLEHNAHRGVCRKQFAHLYQALQTARSHAVLMLVLFCGDNHCGILDQNQLRQFLLNGSPSKKGRTTPFSRGQLAFERWCATPPSDLLTMYKKQLKSNDSDRPAPHSKQGLKVADMPPGRREGYHVRRQEGTRKTSGAGSCDCDKTELSRRSCESGAQGQARWTNKSR